MAVVKKECSNIDTMLEVNRPIQVLLSDGKKKQMVYKSTLADFDKHHLMITPLTKDGAPAELRIGEEVSVLYFSQDATLEFKTFVVNKKRDNNVLLTLLAKPTKCIRIQRRDFFRLPIAVEAQLRRVQVEELDEVKQLKPYGELLPCVIEDISGGGVCFRTTTTFEDDSFAELACTLPAYDEDISFTEIVRIIRTKKKRPLAERGMVEYTYGTSFVELDEMLQTQIIRFIMRMQIDARKENA